MIQFKKSDIGLYVALALVGAGVGLLGGALVASRIKKSRPVEDEDILYDEVLPDEEHAVNKAFDHDYIVEEVEIGEKFEDAVIEEDPISQDEWMEFIEEYSPTAMQINMVTAGLVSMDDMKQMISEGDKLREEAKEQRLNYNSKYVSSAYSDKPDLDELVPEVEETGWKDLEDGRFAVLFGEEAQDVDREFIYTPGDIPTWMFLSGRGNPVSVTSIAQYVTPSAWAEVLPYLEKHGEIGVFDSVTSVTYRFKLEDSESGGDPEEIE